MAEAVRAGGRDGELHGDFLAGAHDGEGYLAVLRDLLNEVAKFHAQAVAELDHALVVDLGVADPSDHIPLLQRVGGISAVGLVDDDALDGFFEFQVGAEGGILQGLEFVEHGGLAVVVAVGDILEKQVYFLAGDDVADVVAAAQAAEGEADHLVAHEGGAAAVAGVDGGVDLDTEAGGRKVIRGKLDAGDDALGDRETGAASGETVDHHGVFHGG